MVVGILNTFAALARPTTLFFSVWRSIDWTPNAICGWWSMKMICEFCGVRTSSFGLVTGDLLSLRPSSWCSGGKSLRLKAPLEHPRYGGWQDLAPVGTMLPMGERMNLLDRLGRAIGSLVATPPVRFIALLGLCAAYI